MGSHITRTSQKSKKFGCFATTPSLASVSSGMTRCGAAVFCCMVVIWHSFSFAKMQPATGVCITGDLTEQAFKNLSCSLC